MYYLGICNVFLNPCILGRNHKIDMDAPTNAKPQHKLNANSSSSTKREDRRSTSRERKSSSLSATNDNSRKSKGHNNHTYNDIDEVDLNHAPPQYSDAVRLPNINVSSHYTSSTMASAPLTKQTEIL